MYKYVLLSLFSIYRYSVCKVLYHYKHCSNIRQNPRRRLQREGRLFLRRTFGVCRLLYIGKPPLMRGSLYNCPAQLRFSFSILLKLFSNSAFWLLFLFFGPFKCLPRILAFFEICLADRSVSIFFPSIIRPF